MKLPKLDFFKQEKIRTIIISSIMIVLGVLLCVIPEKSLNVLEVISAIGLILFGTISIVIYCFTPILFRDVMMLVRSIVGLGIGVLILFIPSFFVFGIGFIVAISGLEKFGDAIDHKDESKKKWIIDLVVGLFIFMLGTATVVLCNTSVASNILMLYFGISIAVDGIVNLIWVLVLHRKVKKVKKIIDENNEGFTDFEVK